MEMSLDRLRKLVINSKMKLETESEAGSSEGVILQLRKRPFLSVTELKKKGVYVKASSTFLFDISFTSYYFFGVLHLPVLMVSSTVLFNMMAMEMAPGTRCVDSVVTSYLNLMKSLIDDAKDVKELQEKGIIASMAEDNNEMVRMLKDMGSYGIEVLPVFDEIKMRINDHCNSKAKTWIADLINSYLRSPWTAIALAATTLLLCLTFLQTYYTIPFTK